MIEIGSYNTLKPIRNTSVGVFMGDDEGTEILLPNKYVPQDLDFDQKIAVFCYQDHNERPVATTLRPKIKRNDFAFLQVMEVNQTGAFLDWGLEKQLLVPFREQRRPMKKGEFHLVYCYLDEKSFRLSASTRLDKFLSLADEKLAVNQKVDLIAWRKSPLGWEMLINKKYKGLLFFSDVFQDISSGKTFSGFIKTIRGDGKIDLSLQPLGPLMLEPTATLILNKIKENGGYLPLNDKSSPEEISKIMGLSKKAFKKGIGILYKQKKIQFFKDGLQATKLD